MELQLAFNALDLNQDGKITKDELLAGFQSYTQEAIDEVDAIFREVDIDGNGEIEFTEWVVASIDKNSLLTQDKLETAFSLFDKDGNGTIDASEVKATLAGGNDIDDKVWEELINEVNVKRKGEIDFGEFCTMMRKLISD